MLKAMAVLRSLFFVFIVAWALRVLPWGWSRTFDEEFARCTATRALAIQAAWMAIAWIALETVVGWWLALRRPKLHDEIPEPGGEPPFSPPPHT